MNIFVLDSDPKLCAQYHNDKHVVKMITEYAQILSTAFYDCKDISDDTLIPNVLYKQTHKNHRCVQWAANNLNNYLWLHNLSCELIEEYHFRFGENPNKFIRAKEINDFIYEFIPNKNRIEPKEFVVADGLCTPLPLSPTTAIHAYHKYYIKDKEHLATWRKRGIPFWYFSNYIHIVNNTPVEYITVPMGIALEDGKKTTL